MRHQLPADCNIPQAVHYWPIFEAGKIAVGVPVSASGSPLPSAGEGLGVRGMQSARTRGAQGPVGVPASAGKRLRNLYASSNHTHMKRVELINSTT